MVTTGWWFQACHEKYESIIGVNTSNSTKMILINDSTMMTQLFVINQRRGENKKTVKTTNQSLED